MSLWERAIHAGVKESAQPQPEEQRDGVSGCRREQRKSEAEEGVGPGLQKQSGQDHAPGRGSFGVRVREPGVHGDQGDLDGKGQEKRGEQKDLRTPGELGANQFMERKRVGPRLGPVDHVQRDQTHQHEQAAGNGVKDELEGSLDPSFVSPHADQEEHGKDLDLPEEVKQEKIRGQENSQNAGFHEHEEKVKSATLWVTWRQETRTQSTVRKAVSRTRTRLIPSAPRL